MKQFPNERLIQDRQQAIPGEKLGKLGDRRNSSKLEDSEQLRAVGRLNSITFFLKNEKSWKILERKTLA